MPAREGGESHPSLHAACEPGLAAEIASGEMHERQLAQTQRENILTLLRKLQQASWQRHLAALWQSAQRGAGGGRDG